MSSQPSESDIETIASAIFEHLRANPLAKDSAAGVARWWLGPAHAGTPHDQVERALESLVAAGLVRRILITDGGVLYSESDVPTIPSDTPPPTD